MADDISKITIAVRTTGFYKKLIHAGHKNLSWLIVFQKAQAHARFKEELYNVTGMVHTTDDAPADVQLIIML